MQCYQFQPCCTFEERGGPSGTDHRFGPTQKHVDRQYASTSLEGAIVSQQGVQVWRVPRGGKYRVTARGAGGGLPGADAAEAQAVFHFAKDTALKVVVGQMGTKRGSGNGGGGGGGSFVVKACPNATCQPLVVGGGGGGPGKGSANGISASCKVKGSGGERDNGLSSSSSGAGFIGNGKFHNKCIHQKEPESFQNGAVGGYDFQVGCGGFGGGGSPGHCSGGGGGGFSGGGSGSFFFKDCGGGGGGSFVLDELVSHQGTVRIVSGSHDSDEHVRIEEVECREATATEAAAIQATSEDADEALQGAMIEEAMIEDSEGQEYNATQTAGAQTATDGPEALAQEADAALEAAGVPMEEAGAAMEEGGAAMEEAGPEAISQEAEVSMAETGQAMEVVEASTGRLDGEKTSQQAEMEQSAITGKPAEEQHVGVAMQENGAFPNNSESSVRTPWQGNLTQEPVQSAQASQTAKETLLKFRFDGNLYRVPLMEHFHMNDIKKIITDTTGCNFDTLWAKYLDDEGDLCVLCAQTLSDCINLMSKAQQESMIMRLEVHHRGARAFRVQERRVGEYPACEDQRVHGPSVDEKLPWQVADQNSDEEEESLEGSPGEEESAGSVATQDKNEFVLVDAEHQSDRCFLKSRTVLRSPDGGCKTVASLQEGDYVLSLSGRQLRVAFKREHPKQLCKLTTLRTSATELTVTSDHRVIVSTGLRGSFEKSAEDVVLGDKVLCGQKTQKVTKVMQHEQRAELVELRFTPDEPVETLMIAHAGILTKGERSPLLAQLEQPIEGLYERHTFLNVREPVISAASQRSRSAER